MGVWRKLHNEDLHSLYSSQYIISVLKSRRMRWVRHVTRKVQYHKDIHCTRNTWT